LRFIVLIWTLCLGGTQRADFSFVFCGDSRFGSRSPNDHPEILGRIVKEVNILRPDFFIYGGDGPDYNSLENYERFKACLDSLRVPYYVVVGNHDIYIPDGGYSRKLHRRFFGRTYYSFTYGNTYFIILDTAGHGTRPWGIRESSPEQWEWMMEELGKVKKYEHTFVVTHTPPYDAPPMRNHAFTDAKEAKEFVELMAKYGVTAVLCSHEHLYYEASWGGVPYIISGGAGAVLYAPPERGGFYHYVRVHVGEDVEVEVVPILDTLFVEPERANLEVGETLEFRAVGVDPFGRSVPLAPPISISWASDDTAVGKIEPSGLFRALSSGRAEVTIECGLRIGRASVRVVPAREGFLSPQLPLELRVEDPQKPSGLPQDLGDAVVVHVQ